MDCRKIFIKVSDDFLCGESPRACHNYITQLEAYAQIQFDHAETDVTQLVRRQNATVFPHVAMGIRFPTAIGYYRNPVTRAFEPPPGGGVGGNIPIVQFEQGFDRFRQKLIRANVRPPYFTVVSHNSAHHFSYGLARMVCRQLTTRFVLFITFDNHTDQHAAFNQNITCQNYVRPLIRKGIAKSAIHFGWHLPNYQRIPMHWVNHFDRHNYQQSAGNPASTCRFSSPDTTYQQKLNNILRRNVFRYAYVTVDRDFMQGSATSYGDGPNHPDNARTAVRDCLQILSNNNIALVGFDVTGLPNYSGASIYLNGAPNILALATAGGYPANTNLPNVGAEGNLANLVAFQDIRYYAGLVNAYQ